MRQEVQGEIQVGLSFVMIFVTIIICACYFLVNNSGIASNNYDPSYKWGIFDEKQPSKIEEKKTEPNPPTHSPIIKSQFGLDLETRWLPSMEDTMRFEREGEILIPEIKKELGYLGFHIAEDEESLSLTHFHKRIRAGGRFLESDVKVIITMDLEDLSRTLGCVVSIQVHCKDQKVSQVILENVKQLLWQ